MTGQQGILFTILTCMTFNRRCTQIHVLFQRVKTERGMCRACCKGIQTPNALVPLTNANSFHLHSTRATPSNAHTRTHARTHAHTHTQTKYRNPRCACAARVNKVNLTFIAERLRRIPRRISEVYVFRNAIIPRAPRKCTHHVCLCNATLRNVTGRGRANFFLFYNIYPCARTAITDAVTIITIARGQLSHML